MQDVAYRFMFVFLLSKTLYENIIHFQHIAHDDKKNMHTRWMFMN